VEAWSLDDIKAMPIDVYKEKLVEYVLNVKAENDAEKAALADKLEKIEGRLDKIERRNDEIEGQLEEVKNDNNQIRALIQQLEIQVQFYFRIKVQRFTVATLL